MDWNSLIVPIASQVVTFILGTISPKMLWGWVVPFFKKLNPSLANVLTNQLGNLYVKSGVYFYNLYKDDEKITSIVKNIGESNEKVQKFCKKQ